MQSRQRQKVIVAFSVLRIVTTALLPVVPLAVHSTGWLPAAFALALLLLDFVDSTSTYWIPGGLECQPLYQGLDKVVDQLQYAVALALVWPILPPPLLSTILGLYLWRWVGVMLFLRDGAIGTAAKRWLVLGADVTKELLVLATVLLITNVKNKIVWTILVIVGKVLFEFGRWVWSRRCDPALR